MITFRIDDIGASTKQFEQYSRTPWANFWFLKRIPPWRAWGPYAELSAADWEMFLTIFKQHQIKPLIAITAAWVEADSSLTPFPVKFPAAASVLKKAASTGLIDIANHGLTHCVVGQHLPRFRHGNRRFHREFWPELDQSIHDKHILKSQNILESYFESPIENFVPPGNVWSIKTLKALQKTNINKVISGKYMLDSDQKMSGIEFIDDHSGFFSFHDRELKLLGKKWLLKKISEFQNHG